MVLKPCATPPRRRLARAAPDDAAPVDAVVPVEPLVLHGQEGVAHVAGDQSQGNRCSFDGAQLGEGAAPAVEEARGLARLVGAQAVHVGAARPAALAPQETGRGQGEDEDPRTPDHDRPVVAPQPCGQDAGPRAFALEAVPKRGQSVGRGERGGRRSVVHLLRVDHPPGRRG